MKLTATARRFLFIAKFFLPIWVIGSIVLAWAEHAPLDMALYAGFGFLTTLAYESLVPQTIIGKVTLMLMGVAGWVVIATVVAVVLKPMIEDEVSRSVGEVKRELKAEYEEIKAEDLVIEKELKKVEARKKGARL